MPGEWLFDLSKLHRIRVRARTETEARARLAAMLDCRAARPSRAKARLPIEMADTAQGRLARLFEAR